MEYKCKYCNKDYSSYQSLWIHNKKYHNVINKNGIHSVKSCLQNVQIGIQNVSNHNTNTKVINKNTICKYCNSELSNRQSRWRHEKICKIQEKLKTESLKIENQKLNEKIQELENNQKLNKKIIQQNKTKNINNGKINNGKIINNKIIINNPGSENIDSLTFEEVKMIMDNEISSVIKLIEYINFNENKPENHQTSQKKALLFSNLVYRQTQFRICITNSNKSDSYCTTALDGPYLSKFNSKTKTIDKTRKRYFFEEIICKHIDNHKLLYEKFKKKFSFRRKEHIEGIIFALQKMKDNSFNDRIMNEMIRDLNLISYNNRGLIQNTWNCNDNDEEFMKIILKDPKYVTDEDLMKLKKNRESAKKSSSISSDDSSSDSNSNCSNDPLSLKSGKQKKSFYISEDLSNMSDSDSDNELNKN